MLTFLSTVVIALPTVSIRGLTYPSPLITSQALSAPPNDGRGATIFTSLGLQGESTGIPGNAWCTDLNNIFGNFDCKVRSIVVEKGYTCQFHVNHGCPANGWKYEFGSKDTALGVGELPEWLNQKIHSIFCAQI
jgi:hypothetical protein